MANYGFAAARGIPVAEPFLSCFFHLMGIGDSGLVFQDGRTRFGLGSHANSSSRIELSPTSALFLLEEERLQVFRIAKIAETDANQAKALPRSERDAFTQ
jgi:hypothetical protein